MKAGWQQATLKDLCIVDWGNTNLTKSAYVDGGEFLAVSAAGCDGRIGHKEHAKYTPVLSAIGAQCGRMFFPEEDFTAIKNTITVTPRDGKCSGRFLYYLLTFVELPQRGAGQPFISKGDIQSFAVTFPSLFEQQRIVGILDAAFDGIATAKANAEQNLQNARALFESHLQSVFTQAPLSGVEGRGEGWETKTLGDIAEVKGGKRVPKGYKLLSEPTAYPYLRVADFTDDGSIYMSDLRYVSAEVHRQIKNYIIYSTDLYLSIAGTIGKTGIIPKELDGANLTENACRLVFKPGFSNRFVYYFTQTASFVDQAGLHTRTAAQPKLALSRLSTIKLGIPSFTEQERLANEFAALRAETQRLESLYQRKLAALDELKKSLLHQAFSGAL